MAENRPLLIRFFLGSKTALSTIETAASWRRVAEVAVCFPWRWRPFWTAVATSARAIWWRAPRCRRPLHSGATSEIRRRSHRNAGFKAFGKGSIELNGGVSGKLCLNPKMSDYCHPENPTRMRVNCGLYSMIGKSEPFDFQIFQGYVNCNPKIIWHSKIFPAG